VLLSTAYFPPVSWFALVAKSFTLSADRVIASKVYLEAKENYLKQTYRNRCVILSSQGRESLSFPIVHDGDYSITEVKVDYSTPWVVRTERAIASAYESSAFFDYYKDDLFSILEHGHARLWDLNLSIIGFFLEKTGIKAELIPTDSFTPKGETSPLYGEDFRDVIHPKRPNTVLPDLGLQKEYFQVFSGKYGFQSDLSIMDLLFNEGPSSIVFLKNIALPPSGGLRNEHI